MNITYLLIVLLITITVYLLQNLLRIQINKIDGLLWFAHVSIALILLEAVLSISSFIQYIPHFYAIAFPVKFLVLPLLILIGSKSVQLQNIPVFLSKRYTLPALVVFILLFPIYSKEASQKLALLQEPNTFIIFIHWLLFVFNIFCTVWFYKICVKQLLPKHIWPLFIGILVFTFSQLLAVLLIDHFQVVDVVTSIAIGVLLILFKLLHSKIKASITTDLLERINKVVVDEKLYLNPELSLKTLANSLNKTPNEISRAINSGLLKSFNEFINEHRVNEVIQLMKNKENDKFTLEAISKMAGFNSTTSFNKNFKNVTGKTPKEYKQLTKS